MAVAALVGREAESRPEDTPRVNVNGIEELVTDKGTALNGIVRWLVRLFQTPCCVDLPSRNGVLRPNRLRLFCF
jgi:hypothetical protein